MESKSEIQKFYEGTTIFLTGGTGFLGKLLIEKLLRSCFVKKIYILVRSKKEKCERDRLEDVFKFPMFKTLKEQNPNFYTKVALITGDCALPDLGLSVSDKKLLSEEVEIVFHCAATVRFDQELRTAAYINVRATFDIIKLAKEMPNLKAFAYVSTAYAHCPNKNIGEIFYDPPMKPSELFELLNYSNDEIIGGQIGRILGKWPNTYSFTKCLAEDVVRNEAKNLPTIIFRPSIVISSYKEPIEGWIDNFYGPIGISSGCILGIIRIIKGDPDAVFDLVPVDYVINCIIAGAWHESIRWQERSYKVVTIYNFVSSPEAHITLGNYCYIGMRKGYDFISMQNMWYNIFLFATNNWIFNFKALFLHWIPAYILDFICVCFRREPRMVEGYKKIHKMLDSVAYFTKRSWNFDNGNTKMLWNQLSDKDKNLFEFSMENFDWEAYLNIVSCGLRIYLLKDPLETIPAAKRKYFYFTIAHYLLLTLIFVLFVFFLTFIYNFFL